MIRQSAPRMLGLMGAAALLQGCVAAALPVLASGAMVGSETKGKTEARVEPAVAPAGTVSPSSSDAADVAFQLFANHVMQQAVAAPGEKPRVSAMLRDPGSLDGARRGCEDLPPGVIIDLDPGANLLSLVTAPQPDPRNPNLLESLRNQGVSIGWISARSAADAGQIRSILAAAGLDRSGKDSLLLLRYPDDRKQTRRNAFAREFCVIAIAGDAPTDFDELYDFIVDPSNATALKPLYGDGWFVIPPLLSQD